MYVVTAAGEEDGELDGCLVGFASQCSIGPARFVVWLSRENRTYRAACRASHLGVHVLSRARSDLARWFGERTGDDTDKFAEVDWRPGPGGAPVLRGARAWFVGRVLDRFEGGDHVGFLLAPVTEGSADADDSADPDDVADAARPGLLRLSDVEHFSPGHPA
ncbi:flavin reductase family protein [Streptomyces sp. NPDC093600]|uniref:flavin reductase family protein n=1 Tax=Streptomyces sp. NPDC093600 TaxID=3366047 RepID=UPI0037F1CA28